MMSTSDHRLLPERLLILPMYLMLALTRKGYRHAVRSKVAIRIPQYAVMAVLADRGSSSQKAIAEAVGFDKSDVTKILNDLERRGWVERQGDPEDNRRHRVTLTQKGKNHLEAGDRELNASMRDFLRGLTVQEYRQLWQLLLKALQVHDERFQVPTEARQDR
jgi:DNA-binding MarR family transcriptional regulator